MTLCQTAYFPAKSRAPCHRTGNTGISPHHTCCPKFCNSVTLSDHCPLGKWPTMWATFALKHEQLPSILSSTTIDRMKIRSRSEAPRTVFVNSVLIIWGHNRKTPLSSVKDTLVVPAYKKTSPVSVRYSSHLEDKWHFDYDTFFDTLPIMLFVELIFRISTLTFRCIPTFLM